MSNEHSYLSPHTRADLQKACGVVGDDLLNAEQVAQLAMVTIRELQEKIAEFKDREEDDRFNHDTVYE